ncbi:MAG: ABC transporter substrate-binding protein, partial [Culicoidibacterales bacterium]
MKNLLKKLTLVGVATLSGIALTACSGGSAKKEAHGVVNVADPSQLNILDPVRAEFSTDKELNENTQAILAELDKDGKTKLLAAEKWEASSDLKTFTIKLRPGMKWSDGSPLTAKDYVFYFDAVKADTETVYKSIFDTLVSYEAKDDTTLVFGFNIPRPLFEMTDLPGVLPLNKAFYEKVGGAGHYGTSNETTLYSGPFVLSEWTGKDATSWKLVKNDKFYDASNVLVEGVNTRYIDNPQTAQQEFDAGNIDFLELRGRAMHDQYKGKKTVKEKQATYYFLKQGKSADLANKNLRLAIDAAINRDEVIQAAPGYEAFEGAISRNSLFDKSGKDIRDYDNAKMEKRYNETKAKEYWEKAKQELGKNTASASYLVFNNAQNIAVAQVIKDQVEKTLPGLTLNIDPKDNNA